MERQRHIRTVRARVIRECTESMSRILRCTFPFPPRPRPPKHRRRVSNVSTRTEHPRSARVDRGERIRSSRSFAPWFFDANQDIAESCATPPICTRNRTTPERAFRRPCCSRITSRTSSAQPHHPILRNQHSIHEDGKVHDADSFADVALLLTARRCGGTPGPRLMSTVRWQTDEPIARRTARTRR